jgi:hypothetical protein
MRTTCSKGHNLQLPGAVMESRTRLGYTIHRCRVCFRERRRVWYAEKVRALGYDYTPNLKVRRPLPVPTPRPAEV